MDLKNQLIVFLVCFGYTFFRLRWLYACIKDYRVSPSAVKKKAKGQTFKEWFLYSRYRRDIPKFFLGLYFVVIALHALVLIFCILAALIAPLHGLGEVILRILFYFDGVLELILGLMFMRTSREDDDIGRWIDKKRGNKKRK